MAPVRPLPLIASVVLEADEGLVSGLLIDQPRVLIDIMDAGQLSLGVHLLALGAGDIEGGAVVRAGVVAVSIEQIPAHWTEL